MTTPADWPFGCRMSGAVPSFQCPSCDVPLRYDASRANDSVDGLVDFSDFYSCPAGCGVFEYERRRHRLRVAHTDYPSSTAGA